jgi:putative transposase
VQAEREGLSDRTRARHQDPEPTPELERAILSIRRRLQAHVAPATGCCLMWATAIRAEVKALGVCPLPCARTIERNGLTSPPRLRLAPLLPRREYPAGKAGHSNQLHQVDRVGPFYLKGAAPASPTGWANLPSRRLKT